MGHEIRCGLAGCGVVGSGVVRLFAEPGYATGARLVRVAVRDLAKKRDCDLAGVAVTDDVRTLVDDPSIDLVVEATGDAELGRRLAIDCFRRGKAFVTAGKELVSRFGPELDELARARAVAFRCEAAVGGALPVVALLRLGLSPGRLRGFEGVLNGTCNYVLSRLHDGLPFDDALDGARRAGFAEPDSRRDTSGRDTAEKLSILARLLGVDLPPDLVPTEGIEGLDAEDAAFGRSHGWSLRLVGAFRDDGERVFVQVAPAFVPERSFLAQARDEENAILFDAGPAGTLGLIGRGAGSLPTASAILSDVREIARGSAAPAAGPARPAEVVTFDLAPSRHYLRLDAPHGPAAVLARLRAAGIPLEAATYASGDRLQLVTKPVSAHVVDAALAQIRAQDAVRIVVRDVPAHLPLPPQRRSETSDLVQGTRQATSIMSPLS